MPLSTQLILKILAALGSDTVINTSRSHLLVVYKFILVYERPIRHPILASLPLHCVTQDLLCSDLHRCGHLVLHLYIIEFCIVNSSGVEPNILESQRVFARTHLEF